MTKELIRNELIERYESTGRVGLTKPRNHTEAMQLIETVVDLYEEEPEEYNFTLKDITNKLKEFLDSF